MRNAWLISMIAAAWQVFGSPQAGAAGSKPGLLEWAQRAGGRYPDHGRGVAVLPDGGTIVTGDFGSSATLGAGELHETVLESAGDDDIFVARYNADGTLAWAKRGGGEGEDHGCAAAAFPDGAALVAGYFHNQATFATGRDEDTTVTSTGYLDVFLARYTPQGELDWVRAEGGAHSDQAFGLAALSDGGCIMTGQFSGLTTFGAGQPTEASFQSPSDHGIFVARFRDDGSLAWAKFAGGETEEYGVEQGGTAVDALADGSSFVTGCYGGTIVFGAGEANATTCTVTSLPSSDIFVARYNPNGSLAWAKSAGGMYNDSGQGIAAFPDGSCAVTGGVIDDSTFGKGEPGETVLPAGGSRDFFIARYRPNGKLQWVKGTTIALWAENAIGWGAAPMPDGGAVAIGGYEGDVTFGLGETNEKTFPSTARDAFVVRYNPDGALAWAKRVRGAKTQEAFAVDALPDGTAFAAGFFESKGVFGSGEPNATFLQSAGGQDIFLARYSPQGWPSLAFASDNGDATLRLFWSNQYKPPWQFLGFAFDIYQGAWVERGWENTLWYPFAPSAASGDVDLGFSGGYHAWISSQYLSGEWYVCQNPWTGILYSGAPHLPVDVQVEPATGESNVRLRWRSDIYGAWLYGIIAYRADAGFVETEGPSGLALWHFVDYGGVAFSPQKASFFDGWADFALPPGEYWLYLRGVAWDGVGMSEYAIATAEVFE